MNEKEIKGKLKELIQRYYKICQENKDTSEANIQWNLIDPLFELLGWNVTDTKEYDRNSYIRGVGFADVALIIKGKPVIFMEAKKLSKIPKNRIEPQDQTVLPFKELQHLIDRTPEEKQAMRYARGEGIDWAILTNFECLFVFNADHERIILSFKSPEEYLTRFNELWELSRERVEAKSLEWVEKQIKKHDIDERFLEKLKSWRLNLANDIYNNNKHNEVLLRDGKFDFDELMHIVQRILSRLLVISIADDMEILETQNILENVFKSYENAGKYVREDYLLTRFLETSHSMDEHHNTMIFSPDHPCEKVKVSNEVFALILNELCNFSFRKMTVDILGATYESYLGYAFQMKNGKVSAEIDPRVRKQAGIYYTPSYIVHYIVDNTLGKMLKEIEEKEALNAIEKAKDIKVLDPACGSGSFLIYAFDVLAEFYDRVNKKITDKQLNLSKGHANPSMFDQLEKFKNLPKQVLDYPKKILEDHLYGVDLDPAAAEIATINLVIKAFEKMKGKKLPLILNQNIKVGNSLISGIKKEEDLDKFKNEISEHIVLRKKLKETEEDKEKQEIMDDINQLREKINLKLNQSLKEHFVNLEEKRPFNWEFEFPEVFDSEKSEGEKGFYIVIGNPPYRDIKELNTEIVDYIFLFYNSTMNRMNIYSTFVHRGLRLLKQEGRFGFIIPNSILTQSSYNKIRHLLLSEATINNIVKLPDHTFREATVETIIFIFHKKLSKMGKRETVVLIFDPHKIIDSIDDIHCKQHYKVSQSSWRSEPRSIINIFRDVTSDKLINKLEKAGQYLEEIAEFCLGLTPYDKHKGHTPSQIKQRAFHSDHKKNNTYKRLLSGEDITRYGLKWNCKEWIAYGSWLGAPREKKFFTAKRILVRQIISGAPLRIYASYTDEEYYNTQIAFNIISKKGINPLYLLCILNSLLLTYFHKIKYLDPTKETFQKILIQDAKCFPIPIIDHKNKKQEDSGKRLVKLAQSMINLNKQVFLLESVFTQVLKNHTYEPQSLGKAYYDRSEYVEKIDKKASAIANSEKEITKISLKEKGEVLFFYVVIDKKWEEALTLKIKDDNLRLFLFYSLRNYLEENKKRKKWTTESIRKVLDVLLEHLEVPVFKTQAMIYDIKHNLKMINLVMKEFKSKFRKKFPKGNIHLSQIEEEIQDTDNSIDALVFKLYGLNRQEVTTVLDSMNVEKEIKEDILIKFKKT